MDSSVAPGGMLHRLALRLEYFTVSWNVVEAVVAFAAATVAGSAALIGSGVDRHSSATSRVPEQLVPEQARFLRAPK